MSRPKVLYVTRAASGGMYKHLNALLEYFKGNWDVKLASPLPGEEAYFLFSVKDSMSYKLPLPGHFSVFKDIASSILLARILQEEKVDLLHVHSYKAALIALPAAHFTGVPALLTVHNYLAYPAASKIPQRFFTKMIKTYDPLVNHYIAVSEALKQDLVSFKVPSEKISTVYNGIKPVGCNLLGYVKDHEPDLKPLREHKGLAVGTAGRLVPQKGIDIFIRAAAELSAVFPHTRFFIAGEGPEKEKLKLLTAELNLKHRVVFLGKVKSIYSFLELLDVFVLASRSEGLSISLLEAGDAGVPVVAAASGGVPEVVKHGGTGLLVPPEDFKSLAEAMGLLLSSWRKRNKMGREAAHRISTLFTEEQMVKKTEKIYERIVCGSEGSVNSNNDISADNFI